MKCAFATLLGEVAQPAHILDIGAHKGDWSKEWLKSANENLGNLSFVLFEPSPMLSEDLENLASELGFIWNANQQVAVTGKTGIAELFEESPRSSDASLVPGGGKFRYPVPTRSLSEILKEFPDTIGIKLDTEGMEWGILSSARSAIAESAIRVIQFEFGEKTVLQRQNFKDFFEFFRILNYDLFRLNNVGLTKICQYSRYHEIHVNTTFFTVRRVLDSNDDYCRNRIK